MRKLESRSDPGRDVLTGQAANGDFFRAQVLAQPAGEIPFGTRPATEQIQAEGTELRKSMARQVRLGKQRQTGDAAGFRKLVPHDFADYVQIQIANNGLE